MTWRDALWTLLGALLFGIGSEVGQAAARRAERVLTDEPQAPEPEDEPGTRAMPCPICGGSGRVRMRLEGVE